MKSPGQTTTIIIPTLNEEKSIGTLIDEILDVDPDLRIVVVDDESSDETSKVVSEKSETSPNRIRFLLRKDVKARGITASVLDAINVVETDYFIVMDGDLQHPPAAIPDMFRELSAEAQIVAGYRLPYEEKQALHRVAATKLSTLIAKLVLRSKGVNVNDPMSGYFGGNTEVCKQLIDVNRDRFEPEGYKILFDLLRTSGRTLKITQVPYTFRIRMGGKSKLSARHGWLFLRSLFR